RPGGISKPFRRGRRRRPPEDIGGVSRRPSIMTSIALCVVALLAAATAAAQELDPRQYSPAPVGTTIVLGGFGGSKGGILFDPSLDVADVQADLRIVTAGVG